MQVKYFRQEMSVSSYSFGIDVAIFL